jgi:hypothetical protein
MTFTVLCELHVARERNGHMHSRATCLNVRCSACSAELTSTTPAPAPAVTAAAVAALLGRTAAFAARWLAFAFATRWLAFAFATWRLAFAFATWWLAFGAWWLIAAGPGRRALFFLGLSIERPLHLLSRALLWHGGWVPCRCPCAMDVSVLELTAHADAYPAQAPGRALRARRTEPGQVLALRQRPPVRQTTRARARSTQRPRACVRSLAAFSFSARSFLYCSISCSDAPGGSQLPRS